MQNRKSAGGRAALSGAVRAHARALGLVSALLAATPAGAQSFVGTITPETVVNLALVALTVGAAMIAAVWLIRQQAATAEENDRLRAELVDALGEAERRGSLLAEDGHRVVIYAGGRAPDIVGQLPRAFSAPGAAAPFLDWRGWLGADEAAALETAVAALRTRAEPFRLQLERGEGAIIEVAGRTVGALAVLRFAPLEGLREELAALRLEQDRSNGMIETMQSLFDAAPMPMWLRETGGEIVWVNNAYARAVEAPGVPAAVERGIEFLGEADRLAIGARRKGEGRFSDRLTAVVDGDRRNFHVVDAAGPFGSAGLAVDISETEIVRRELRETVRSHSETLDHLTTAVARFDERMQLSYNNAAFAKLFDLQPSYLASRPDHAEIVDRLRSAGILPEDKPLRDIKADLQAAHRAAEPTDVLWHLMDGRTLRVFTSPEPQGGATWVYEDLTEKLQLESRLNALVRLQGETLDYLTEGVAVFGQDGRLLLSNPAFAELWGLRPEFLAAKPHIRVFERSAATAIRPGAPATWSDFTRAVAAFDEAPREPATGELELEDGRTQAYGLVPLPNGQTMLTFADVTDARAAERMLRERNEGLELAARLKNDFVQHVNYELRSPLTNIIGFSALLRSADTGPLNERQSEYLDYIGTSTSTLLTIVNDILDLATIDAGIMDLDLAEVDIAGTVAHAADAVRDRLDANGVSLRTDISRAGATFRADGHRVTQILFNLLSNAANFAPAGSVVDLKVARESEAVVFTVADSGPGIPPADVERLFERFEANPSGGRQSGAGLGLSIVKSFMELHGGSVEVAPRPGGGTLVRCRFPAPRRDKTDLAAE